MIISRTPFRVSVGGGGSDLPFFYSQRGGALTTATIDKYLYIIVQKRRYYDDYFIRYMKTEYANKLEDIEHELVREALKLLKIHEPIEVTSVSDIPAGTGLGSSSTFLVGLLNALHALKGERVSKTTLAEEASKIMMEILKQPVGYQDQYAAAFGGMNHMTISKAGKVAISPLDISDGNLKKLQDRLAFMYTGLLHSSTEILDAQKKEASLDDMDSIKKLGAEIKKALETGNLRRFGQCLNIHWETKRRLTSKMRVPEIDAWYGLAIKNGAIGGKLMGAGGGGFLMFYVDKDKEKFIKEMEDTDLKNMDWAFDYDGSTIVFESSNGKRNV